MATERLMFVVLIAMLMAFLAWLIGLKYLDKWREKANP